MIKLCTRSITIIVDSDNYVDQCPD